MIGFHHLMELLAFRVAPFVMVIATGLLLRKRMSVWTALAVAGSVAIVVAIIVQWTLPEGISVDSVDGAVSFRSVGEALRWFAYVPLHSIGAIMVAIGLTGYAVKESAT